MSAGSPPSGRAPLISQLPLVSLRPVGLRPAEEQVEHGHPHG